MASCKHKKSVSVFSSFLDSSYCCYSNTDLLGGVHGIELSCKTKLVLTLLKKMLEPTSPILFITPAAFFPLSIAAHYYLFIRPIPLYFQAIVFTLTKLNSRSSTLWHSLQ